jgi:hypothetical protein
LSAVQTTEPGHSLTLRESFAGCSERPSSKVAARSADGRESASAQCLGAKRNLSHPPAPSCRSSSFQGPYVDCERCENAAGGLCQQPASATLSASGQFSWPAAAPAGSYTLTYFAQDSSNAKSGTGTVNITVQASSSGPPPPASSAPPASSGGGGGCTLSHTDSVDMLMPALFLLSFALWAWRAKKRRLSVGLDETHCR